MKPLVLFTVLLAGCSQCDPGCTCREQPATHYYVDGPDDPRRFDAWFQARVNRHLPDSEPRYVNPSRAERAKVGVWVEIPVQMLLASEWYGGLLEPTQLVEKLFHGPDMPRNLLHQWRYTEQGTLEHRWLPHEERRQRAGLKPRAIEGTE